MKYAFLEPIQIGGLTLKNRVISLAMAKNLSDDEGFITDEQIEYYENTARGGAALIVPGGSIIDPDWPSVMANQPGLYDDKFVEGLRRLTSAVQSHGAKIFLQLWHPGEVDYSWDIPEKPKTVNELTMAEMQEIKAKFVKAATVCQKAGADGIEIQVCHNYLLAQFLSPHFNKRTDEYGGCLENRLRFPMEVMTAIKNECGRDFPMSVKVNGSDFVPDGINPDMAADACAILEKAGADMFVMSGGGEHTLIYGMSGDGDYEEGWKVPFAEKVKAKVSVPVAATGSLRHPEFVSQIISDGRCDLVGIGRGLLAEPEYVKKCQEGRENELRYCLSCMYCMNYDRKPGEPGCTINPYAVRSGAKKPLQKDGNGRVVAVIGAGPAGLESACVLAERGFKPVIFEKAAQIGGTVQLAKCPPGRSKLGWLAEYYERQLKRLCVEVRLNTEATEEMIAALDPYAVIVAAGSVPFIPPIPGVAGNEKVLDVRHVLRNDSEFKKLSGEKIIVAGAGDTGLETAMMMRVAGNDVTVVEMMGYPDEAVTPMNKMLILNKSLGSGVKALFSHKLLSVGRDEIEVENLAENKVYKLPMDKIIMALGVKPEVKLYDALKEKRANVYNVGDSNKVAQIVDAIYAANTLAIGLK